MTTIYGPVNLTLDTIKMAQRKIEETPSGKMPVIYFSPIFTNVLEGELVDKILRCDKNEKGFFVPESFRLQIPKTYIGIITSYIEKKPEKETP